MDIEWNEIACFFVHGEPKPQPRAKSRVMWRPFTQALRAVFSKRNRLWMVVTSPRGQLLYPSSIVYNPDNADEWKRCVKIYAGRHAPHAPRTDLLRVDIHWHMPRPQRLMRKRDPEGAILYDGAYDRDNLDKSTLDAMTECGWWVDDRQAVGGEIMKFYHAKGGRPGAWVVVSELVEQQEQAALFEEAMA